MEQTFCKKDLVHTTAMSPHKTIDKCDHFWHKYVHASVDNAFLLKSDRPLQGPAIFCVMSFWPPKMSDPKQPVLSSAFGMSDGMAVVRMGQALPSSIPKHIA